MGLRRLFVIGDRRHMVRLDRVKTEQSGMELEQRELARKRLPEAAAQRALAALFARHGRLSCTA